MRRAWAAETFPANWRWCRAWRGCATPASAQLNLAQRSVTPSLASTLDETAAELAALKDPVTEAKDCPLQDLR
jgi:hypothetical protein